ncbi:hypothetical protein R3B00_001310 [Klebsiella pneumoniae]|nr:hypothetical protein [Klebsiella pneumoniae]ELQ8980648.1 hypothetical protein [Klebsiella pneumoniae]
MVNTNELELSKALIQANDQLFDLQEANEFLINFLNKSQLATYEAWLKGEPSPF